MASWQCPLPPVVPVVVNPATQTSEPIAAQMAPFQTIKKSSCACANYCSSALVALFADLACADIAAATAAVTPPQRRTLKATTVPDHSQVYVHASQLGEVVSCQRHQRGARRTYGFPVVNVRLCNTIHDPGHLSCPPSLRNSCHHCHRHHRQLRHTHGN
jgi:hypothetical protein